MFIFGLLLDVLRLCTSALLELGEDLVGGSDGRWSEHWEIRTTLTHARVLLYDNIGKLAVLNNEDGALEAEATKVGGGVEDSAEGVGESGALVGGWALARGIGGRASSTHAQGDAYEINDGGPAASVTPPADGTRRDSPNLTPSGAFRAFFHPFMTNRSLTATM